MPKILQSDDGQYLAAQQEDGNFVVYRKSDMSPLWDRWSYEAATPAPMIPNPLPDFDNNPTIESSPKLITRNCNPIGMAYWRNINNHEGRPELVLFLSIDDELVLFYIDKRTLEITSSTKLNIHHTGEGCYFSATRHDILYIPTDKSLIAVNIYTGDHAVVWLADNGTNLWQCHSSYSENVHSATIKDENYNIIKWGVSINGQIRYYPLKGDPDECQIDKSGQYLVIKEDNYNRIIHLLSGVEQLISNEAGALGHSDCGFNTILGENDYSSFPGACDLIHLDTLERRIIYSTGIWNMGYVSFTNARPAYVNQHCLITTPEELIKVDLDTSSARVVCKHLTESQDYEKRPKANLCPLGEFAAYTSFIGGSLNAYIVRV